MKKNDVNEKNKKNAKVQKGKTDLERLFGLNP